MSAQVPETSPRRILDIAYSYFKSQVLFGACDVGIFSAIENLGQSATAKDLTQKLDLSEDGVKRLLNACVSLQLLQKVPDADGQDTFQNTQESREWLGNSPWNISNFAKFHQHLVYPSKFWRFGKIAKTDSNDETATDPYQILYGTRERMLQFQGGMDGLIKTSYWLLPQLPIKNYKSSVDLAGGLHGFIAREIKKLYPHMMVTLTELPAVIKEAQNTGLYEETGVQLASVDFFKDPLPAADVYLLGHIIHNWEEDKIGFILKAVYEVLTPGGLLVLLEITVDSCKTEPWLAVAADMEMYWITEGRERTGDEYRTLLLRHGFVEIKVLTDPRSPAINAILAWKKP